MTEGTGLGDYTAESTDALLGTTLAEKNGLDRRLHVHHQGPDASPWRACSMPAPRSATTPCT